MENPRSDPGFYPPEIRYRYRYRYTGTPYSLRPFFMEAAWGFDQNVLAFCDTLEQIFRNVDNLILFKSMYNLYVQKQNLNGLIKVTK
jgi:hypothetical protein